MFTLDPVFTHSGGILAAVDIMYDVSPIIVTVNDRPPSFLHFMVRMCAVVGGVFAVTSKCGTV